MSDPSDTQRQGLLALPGWEDMDQHGLADWLMTHGHFDLPDAGGGLNPALAAAAMHARHLGLTEEGPLTELLTHLSVSSGRDHDTAAKEARRAALRSATGFDGPVGPRVRRMSKDEQILNAQTVLKGHPTSVTSPAPVPDDPHAQLAAVLEQWYEPTDLLSVQTSTSEGRLVTVADLLVDGPPPPGPHGVYWRANPVSGASGRNTTCTDADTARFEWMMLESDILPLEVQLPLLLSIGIRPAWAAESGGKSVQLAIRVNATDEASYRDHSVRLCHGLHVIGMDPVTVNSSRLRRLPGAVRPDGKDGPDTVQRLVYLDPDAPVMSVDEIDAVLARVQRRLSATGLIWVADVHVDVTAPPTDFVEGLFTRNSLIVVYGDSNVGKSFFMLDLCAHMATGKLWRPGCGDIITEPTPILYIALEGMVGLTQRIHVMKERGILDPAAPFAIMSTPINLQDAASAKDVLARVEAFKAKVGLPPGFIVVDTLSRAFGPGSENDSKDMTQAVRNLDVIKVKCPAAISPIHHSGKDQARGARGHSALRAATDTEIELFRNEGESVITAVVKKQRDLEPCAPMPFELESVPIYTNARGKVVTSCVVRHLPASEAGTKDAERARERKEKEQDDWEEYCGWLEHLPQSSQRQLAEVVGVSQSTISKRLKWVVGERKARHRVDSDGSIHRILEALPDID